jgi:hypothetical protein
MKRMILNVLDGNLIEILTGRSADDMICIKIDGTCTQTWLRKKYHPAYPRPKKTINSSQKKYCKQTILLDGFEISSWVT